MNNMLRHMLPHLQAKGWDKDSESSMCFVQASNAEGVWGAVDRILSSFA